MNNRDRGRMEKWPLDLVDEEMIHDLKEQFLQWSKNDGMQRIRARDTSVEATVSDTTDLLRSPK